MRRAEWLLLAVLLTACEDQAPAPLDRGERATAPEPTPAVVIAGCTVWDDDACVVRPSTKGRATLRLWIDLEAAATIEAEIDGEPTPIEPQPADGGQHLIVRVPDGSQRVVLRGGEPPWSEPVTIPLRWEAEPEIARRGRLQAGGRAEDAPTVAELEAALAELRGPERLAVLQVLWRALEGPERHRRAEETMALAQELGRERDVASAASAVVFELTTRRSFAHARALVDRMDRLRSTVPEARVWSAYSGGLVAAASGDLTEAVRRMEDAERWATRLGMTRERIAALDQHAVLLGELGRAHEAGAVIERGLAFAETLPCWVRARAQGNLGWAHLRLVQQGLVDEAPREVFERSLRALEHECPDPASAAIQRVNLALALLVDGEPEQAWELHQQLVAEGVPPSLEPWVEELGGQIAVATGRWSLAPPVLLRPRPTDELGLDWSIAVRRARLLSSLGMHDAAIEIYAEAEAMLDEAARGVGVNVGKELFLSGRSASARELVRELVARGSAPQALCRARIARRRALRTIDRAARIASLPPEARTRWEQVADAYLETQAELQRLAKDDWELSDTQHERRSARREERHREATAALDEALRSLLGEVEDDGCDSLPPWPIDEPLLLLTADAEGVIAFAARSADEATLATAATQEQGERAAVESALARLGPALEGATRIRLMVDELPAELRWPTLRVGDGALLDVAPLVHALDLGERASDPRPQRRALVIADPSEDLPAARAEAAAVEQALADAGWVVEQQRGAQATRAAMIEALGRASLLHYAGHGRHGGEAGWDAALRLHEGELSVTDLLAVPRVPTSVVLAGCETGSHSAGAWAGGINLGRAFVLAGTTQVLVAEGRIEDELARRAGEGLARRLAARPTLDLALALREVQLELREQAPASEWWRLKVLVP